MKYTISRITTRHAYFDEVQAGTEEEAIEKVKHMLPTSNDLQVEHHVHNDGGSGVENEV